MAIYQVTEAGIVLAVNIDWRQTMRVISLLSLVLSLLLSCSSHAWQRGAYVFGHQVRTIQLCGDSRVYWVSASPHIRTRLESDSRRLTSRPYQEIYVEFTGGPIEGPREGFAANYDGVMEVREIHEISEAIPEECQRVANQRTGAASDWSTPRTFVFACEDDYEFVARIEGEKAWVFRPEGTVGLPHVPSGSGGKYSNGTVTFWTKGQDALLDDDGMTHRGCRDDPRRAVWEHAKLSGADFRAVGNEPGWHLEILQQSRIVLVADYGAARYEFDLPEPTVDREARVTRYETSRDGHGLTLVLRAHRCRDTMSGEEFETEVVVTLDGRQLRGCGRALH